MSQAETQYSNAPAPSDLSKRLPDTYLLIACVGLLVFLLSYLVTPGHFTVDELVRDDGSVARVIDPESFRYEAETRGAPLFSSDGSEPGLFNAIYEGLVSGSRTGGAVGIIRLNTVSLVIGSAVISPNYSDGSLVIE